MQTEWLDEILNDIWNTSVATGNTRLKTLQDTTTSISVRGKDYYDMGEEWDEETAITVLDGSVRGTATGGASTTITLAAADAMTVASASGKKIFTTGGTGPNQLRKITSLDTATKIATIDAAWTTTVASGTTYLVVDKTHKVDEISPVEMDEMAPATEGIPTMFMKFKRQIVFNRPFDLSTYGVFYRYFVNIHEVDLASTLMTRIYQNWRSVLAHGLTWKALFDQGDAEWGAAKSVYDGMVAKLILKELAYGGEFEGFSIE